MNILVNKESNVPIYRQISMQIMKMVQDGTLSPGDKLPPERQMADDLGLARGTIKKAYMELEKNRIIDITQGRGSFISLIHEIQSESRKERALAVLEQSLDALSDLKFEDKEILTLLQIVMMERRSRKMNFSIATVDCNPESLEIFHRQLSYITKITIHDHLLDDIVNRKDAEESLEVYDLILTTTTHHAELVGLLPGLKGKIFQAAVAPNYQTIIDLSSIKENDSIGIVCESRIFDRIIRQRLRSIGIPTGGIKTIRYRQLQKFEEFISDKDVLIMPPDGEAKLAAVADELEKYRMRSGSIIHFVYQIERGSLIYIEEQISRMLEAKR